MSGKSVEATLVERSENLDVEPFVAREILAIDKRITQRPADFRAHLNPSTSTVEDVHGTGSVDRDRKQDRHGPSQVPFPGSAPHSVGYAHPTPQPSVRRCRSMRRRLSTPRARQNVSLLFHPPTLTGSARSNRVPEGYSR